MSIEDQIDEIIILKKIQKLVINSDIEVSGEIFSDYKDFELKYIGDKNSVKDAGCPISFHNHPHDVEEDWVYGGPPSIVDYKINFEDENRVDYIFSGRYVYKIMGKENIDRSSIIKNLKDDRDHYSDISMKLEKGIINIKKYEYNMLLAFQVVVHVFNLGLNF